MKTIKLQHTDLDFLSLTSWSWVSSDFSQILSEGMLLSKRGKNRSTNKQDQYAEVLRSN